MAYDAIFSEVQRMVRDNARFRDVESGRFNRTLFSWFTQVVAAAVRRQLKYDDDSISLRQFLRRVHDHPGVISRKRYLAFYAQSDDWLRDRARRQFDRYAGCVPRTRNRIRLEFVSGHMRDLRRDRFWRLEQWVDRFVAHTDPQGMALPTPRLRDLRSCLATLDRILQTYRLLLKGVSGTIRPTILDDWTAVFRFVWHPLDERGRSARSRP